MVKRKKCHISYPIHLLLLNSKYNSYFPTKVQTVDDLLKLARIKKSELKNQTFLDEKQLKIPNLNLNISKKFPKVILGLSDHTISNLACYSAVAKGACIVERHFTDTKKRRGESKRETVTQD